MKIILELDVNEVQIVLNGLAELPAKVSIETILKIKAETEKQIADYETKQIT
jgi:hypothetical protein